MCGCGVTLIVSSLEGDDEISFDPDDIIENIEEVDEGWWMGTVNGKRGLFPSNYVEAVNF